MVDKLSFDKHTLEPVLAERLADLMFEIGKDSSKAKQQVVAVKWFERALDTLEGRDLETLSHDAGELYVSIVHGTVRALLQCPGEGHRAKAWNTVDKLNAQAGDTLAVLLLKLDLYASDATSPAPYYHDVLRKIVHKVHLTEINIKTILHHVHKLRLLEPELATNILVSLLLDRLLDADKPTWVERVLVTIFWNIMTSVNPAAQRRPLENVVNSLIGGCTSIIGPSATHAIQIVGCLFT